MGRIDEDGTLGCVFGVLDESGSLVPQAVHDMAVVDDLVADVDRRAILDQGLLDDRDRPLDASAKVWPLAATRSF